MISLRAAAPLWLAPGGYLLVEASAGRPRPSEPSPATGSSRGWASSDELNATVVIGTRAPASRRACWDSPIRTRMYRRLARIFALLTGSLGVVLFLAALLRPYRDVQRLWAEGLGVAGVVVGGAAGLLAAKLPPTAGDNLWQRWSPTIRVLVVASLLLVALLIVIIAGFALILVTA